MLEERERLKTMQKEAKKIREKGILTIWSLSFIEEGMNISDLANVMDATYSHMLKIVNNYEKNGFIVLKSKGREKQLELTDNGKKLRALLITLREFL